MAYTPIMKSAFVFLCFFGFVLGTDETCQANGDSCDTSSDEVNLMQTRLDLRSGSVKTSGTLVRKKSKLDINQKAYIAGRAVLGDGAGHGDLNKCIPLHDLYVQDPNYPEVKVCGTGIRMTVYLLGRCGEGHPAANMAHTWDIGSCDTAAPPSTCDSFGPSQDPRMGASQSYKITQC